MRYVIQYETCFDESYDIVDSLEVEADSEDEAITKAKDIMPYHSVIVRIWPSNK